MDIPGEGGFSAGGGKASSIRLGTEGKRRWIELRVLRRRGERGAKVGGERICDDVGKSYQIFISCLTLTTQGEMRGVNDFAESFVRKKEKGQKKKEKKHSISMMKEGFEKEKRGEEW